MNKRIFAAVSITGFVIFACALIIGMGAFCDEKILDIISDNSLKFTIFILCGAAITLSAAALFSAFLEKARKRESEKNNNDSMESYEEFEPFIRQSERMRQEFTANVSHEMKTPLQSISGYAELLKSGMVSGSDVELFSGRIYTEAQRMISLVEDVLELSHLDEGVKEMEVSDVDFKEIVSGVVESLKGKAEAADVTVRTECDTAVIRGYHQLIYLIVFNLCENAIKYNLPGGNVKVSVKKHDREATLTISDSGIGIPEDQFDRIFERFYRVDKSRSKEVGGTGLGLSIVKHAVQMHDGKISLNSTVGKGTSVKIDFPAG